MAREQKILLVKGATPEVIAKEVERTFRELYSKETRRCGLSSVQWRIESFRTDINNVPGGGVVIYLTLLLELVD